MVNYFRKLIPNLPEMILPLLKLFDPNLPLRLKINASSEELRALFEQNHG